MSHLKSNLQSVLDGLKELEERARKLKNQLSGHPDLELLDEKPDQPAGEFDPKAPTTKEEAAIRMREAGAPDPEGAARMRWPHLFDAPATGVTGL